MTKSSSSDSDVEVFQLKSEEISSEGKQVFLGGGGNSFPKVILRRMSDRDWIKVGGQDRRSNVKVGKKSGLDTDSGSESARDVNSNKKTKSTVRNEDCEDPKNKITNNSDKRKSNAKPTRDNMSPSNDQQTDAPSAESDEVSLIAELPPLLHRKHLKTEHVDAEFSGLEVPKRTPPVGFWSSPKAGSGGDGGVGDQVLSVKNSPASSSSVCSGMRTLESPTGMAGIQAVLKPSAFINNKDCLKIQSKLAMKKKKKPRNSSVERENNVAEEAADVKPDVSISTVKSPAKYVDKTTSMDEGEMVSSSSGVTSSTVSTVSVGIQVSGDLLPEEAVKDDEVTILTPDKDVDVAIVTPQIIKNAIACQTNTEGFIEVLEPECMFMVEKNERKLMYLREMELMYYKEYMKIRTKCRELEASMFENDRMSECSFDSALSPTFPSLRSTVLVSNRPMSGEPPFKEASPSQNQRKVPIQQIPISNPTTIPTSMKASEDHNQDASKIQLKSPPNINPFFSTNETMEKPENLPIASRSLPMSSAPNHPPNYQDATTVQVPIESIPQQQREQLAQHNMAEAMMKNQNTNKLMSPEAISTNKTRPAVQQDSAQMFYNRMNSVNEIPKTFRTANPTLRPQFPGSATFRDPRNAIGPLIKAPQQMNAQMTAPMPAMPPGPPRHLIRSNLIYHPQHPLPNQQPVPTQKSPIGPQPKRAKLVIDDGPTDYNVGAKKKSVNTHVNELNKRERLKRNQAARMAEKEGAKASSSASTSSTSSSSSSATRGDDKLNNDRASWGNIVYEFEDETGNAGVIKNNINNIIENSGEEEILICARCQKSAEYACSRCREARYCGVDCQMLHWKESHMHKCKNNG